MSARSYTDTPIDVARDPAQRLSLHFRRADNSDCQILLTTHQACILHNWLAENLHLQCCPYQATIAAAAADLATANDPRTSPGQEGARPAAELPLD